MPAWLPGQSGNPGGRPKADAELKEACRKHSPEVIEILLKYARGRDARAAVAACNTLLDRGYGKPAQAITGADGENELRVVVRTLFAPAGGAPPSTPGGDPNAST